MKSKITGVFILFFFLFLTVVAKALYVQVINRDKLIAYSESQLIREIKIYPKRGYILDRKQNPLAINVQKYNLFTFLKNKKEFFSELRELKKIIPNLNYNKLEKAFKRRKKFTWIARKIELDEKEVKAIEGFKNISIESISSRFYPNHELLAQTLGFVGIDNDGLAGLEYQFNDELKGEAQIYKYFKDAKGRPIKFESAEIETKPKDLVLSIDKDVQSILEDSLKEGVLKHEALRGGAAVMDAQTGEIWAIANYPTFDPNGISKGDSIKLSFVTDPFEPGSVMKTLTIAAAIENNTVREDTNYFCERGRFKVDNHFIKESDTRHAYEWLSVSEILKLSSNIGTTKIAFDLGYKTLHKYFKKFNLGEKTGIELPGESRGILDNVGNVSPLRLSNISFGQGVATTGIQMLASYAAVANGGYFVKPTLLKIEDPSKIESRKILSKKTADSVTQMLNLAVDEGTGDRAQVAHFKIAGKTSTAQRTDEKGQYSGYISGFLGFPINVNKKFVVFVYIDNPTKGYYGNQVAAPIFQKIVKSILYRNKEYNSLAEYKKTDKKNIDRLHFKYSSKRIVKRGVVPNLIGLDKISAFKILDSLDAKYDHRGFGVVRGQSPNAGEVMSSDTLVKLNFKAPKYDE